MAAYPATLPRPTFDGYALKPVDPVARSGFEAGRLQARSRVTRAPTQIPVRWVFTEAEFAVFESWFRHVALDGAARFDVELASGQGINSLSAQFADGWHAEALSGLSYGVGATLQVRAVPLPA